MISSIQSSEDLVKIFKSYNSQIFRYLYVRTHYNKESAQDLTQDVFLKVWEKRKMYNSSKSSVKTWIFRIARNTLIDFYRRSRNRSVPIDEQIIQVDDTDNTDNEIIYNNILDKLEYLTHKEQDLITFYYIEDLSISEISEIIKKKYTATKISIYRALNKLKKLVNEDDNKQRA